MTWETPSGEIENYSTHEIGIGKAWVFQKGEGVGDKVNVMQILLRQSTNAVYIFHSNK